MIRDQRDSGDTLMEILVALVIISIAAVAILTTFTTTIRASVEYRGLSYVGTVISSVESRATADLSAKENFQSCFGDVNPLSTYSGSVQDDLQGYVDSLSQTRGLEQGSYTVSISTISFWGGSQWTTPLHESDMVSACPDISTTQPTAQLVTFIITAPNGATYSAAVVAGALSW